MTFPFQNSEGTQIGENFSDLLTRIDKIPLETIVEISHQYSCPQEFAGVLYLLSTNLNIDPNLTLYDLKFELDRLEKINQNVPQIETYLYNYAINEGKWIAFLRGGFYQTIQEEIKNIEALFNKIGKLKGSDLITLATQLIMERQFIASNKIIPIIDKWQEEHKDSISLDGATQILVSMIGEKNSRNIYDSMEMERTELKNQIETLGDILSNAEQSNWVIRSLIEVEILIEDLNQPLEKMTSKGLADIIIWLLAKKYQKKIGDFTTAENVNKLIMRFQLESAIGLSTATPQAKLEYKLLQLNYKDDLAKQKLNEQIIIDTWKELKLSQEPISIGREILAMLSDYSSLPNNFLNKVPRHFEYIATYYKIDNRRLSRALDRFKLKNMKVTEEEIQEAIIIDYLIHFTQNYIINKETADFADVAIPDEVAELDLGAVEKEAVNMIDATLRRGLRSQDKSNAIKILETQIMSMYQRCLGIIQDEVTVGETLIYGVLNNRGIKITREEARTLILKHLARMQVVIGSTSKKRLDSVVQKAIVIEITEKILDKNIK